MAENMRTILSLILSIGLLYALATLFKPFGPIRKRRHGALVALASFVLIGVLAPSSAQKAVRPAERSDANGAAATGAEPRPERDRAEKAGGLSDQNREELWIEKTKRAVRNKMRDPSSVEFRNVRFERFDGTPVVCGEVNAKNGLGGYSGFEPFIASGDSFGPFMPSTMDASEFRKTWNQMCSG